MQKSAGMTALVSYTMSITHLTSRSSQQVLNEWYNCSLGSTTCVSALNSNFWVWPAVLHTWKLQHEGQECEHVKYVRISVDLFSVWIFLGSFFIRSVLATPSHSSCENSGYENYWCAQAIIWSHVPANLISPTQRKVNCLASHFSTMQWEKVAAGVYLNAF